MPQREMLMSLRSLFRYWMPLLVLALSSCMDYGPAEEEIFDVPRNEPLVFVVCEGNFQYGNASLSLYYPDSRQVENSVFARANGIPLGDVAQSMTVRDGKGYVVVNKSGIVFVIDLRSLKITGSIPGLASPRYIHFVNDTKAYITDLYAGRIAVVNPTTCRITGYISTGDHKSTERMVAWGDYVFTNCWSYDDCILVIDTRTDTVVGEITVGAQPSSMALDRNGKLWCTVDGDYGGAGEGTASLVKIDAATRTVERQFDFPVGDSPRSLTIDGAGERLYFINRSVWSMPVDATGLPADPVLPYRGTLYYTLGVDPVGGELYVADAVDYMQAGVVYRLTSGGETLDSFRCGIIPGGFCFVEPES